jgi:diguanylate cyclase (GGDEF)-like protein
MNETVHNLWASDLVEDAPIGVVLFDLKGRACWANRHMLRMLGVPSMDMFLSSQDSSDSVWRDVFTQPENLYIQGEDGNELHLDCSYHDYNGSRQGRAGFYLDVGDRHQLSKRVERLTMNDALTSMLNWRGIRRELDILVSRSRRYENALSVIHVRIDASDDHSVLAASRCLREQTRWTDMVGRHNEDGFLVILPETAERDTCVLADKIKQAIESVHKQAGLREPLKVQIAAIQWKRGEDTGLLLERLDAQLETANAA